MKFFSGLFVDGAFILFEILQNEPILYPSLYMKNIVVYW